MKDLIMNSERHALATSLHSSVVLEPKTMLRITTESKRGKLFLSVEGCLSGPRVATLEQCWRELYATNPRPKFCVNLCGVSFIDNAGKVLLKEMHRLGAELVAEGCLNQAIVNEITAAKNGAPSRDAKDDDPSKGAPIIFYIILFGLLLAPGFASAQTSSSALPANAPTDVLKLTLQQSVALAIKQNPTQQIAVLNAAESIQDKNITRADPSSGQSARCRFRQSRKPACSIWRQSPARVPLPRASRSLPGLFCRTGLRHQCLRFLSLEALSGRPQQRGRQQSQ